MEEGSVANGPSETGNTFAGCSDPASESSEAFASAFATSSASSDIYRGWGPIPLNYKDLISKLSSDGIYITCRDDGLQR